MRIRVATLNVWGLPEPFGRNVPARMEAIGRALLGPQLDVIGFQEVWTADARRTLVEAGRKAGLVHVWHRDTALGGSGLLVLSRLAVGKAHFETFALRGAPRRPDHGDYYSGKGFVRLELETAMGPVSFLDTHLHARYTRDVPHAYRAQRTAQIVQLVTSSLETSHPLIAAGDFNVREGQPEYLVLTGLSGLRDLAVEADRRQPTVFRGNPYRAGSSKSDRRIDLLLARDGFTHHVKPVHIERAFDDSFEIDGQPASYSDHAGVVAEVEIGPREPAAVPILDARAIELAAGLLSEGREAVVRQRQGDRALAGIGFGGALLAAAGVQSTRRRFLRATLQGTALVALTPGVGFSVLSEIVAPGDLRVYDDLAARLAQLDRDAVQSVFASADEQPPEPSGVYSRSAQEDRDERSAESDSSERL